MNEARLRELFPNASEDFIRLHLDQPRLPMGELSRPILEPTPGDGPLATPQAKAGYAGRVLVRVTSYRRRLLDEDNLAAKGFCDLCRYAGIIRGDAPAEASIEAKQVKVATKEEEGTLIEIFPL